MGHSAPCFSAHRTPSPVSRSAAGGLALLLIGSLLAATPLAAQKARGKTASVEYTKEQERRIGELPDRYRTFLLEVEVLITESELEGFLALAQDYQRDAFIDRFWQVRDDFPRTARNEFKERYQDRLANARQTFGAIDNEPAQLYLLNGEPTLRLEEPRCSRLEPIMIWFYKGSDQVFFEFFLIFYREFNSGPWRLWYPSDGLDKLTRDLGADVSRGADQFFGGILRGIQETCQDGDFIAAAIATVLNDGLDYGALVARMKRVPELKESEWVATFNSYSTDVAADARALPAELQIEYPGHRQARTVVQGILTVPRDKAAAALLGGHRSYNFVLNGEVLRDGELFDNFRFKFDLPEAQAPAERLPLIFERTLRPGEYTLVIKLEDVNGPAFFREERSLAVPVVDKAAPPPPPSDPESARLLAEANRAIESGETTVQIVPPTQEILTGLVRFDALTTGDVIAQVRFALDDKAVLTKRSPPYSVELDLGAIPRARRLEVVALDGRGEEVARDDLQLNAGGSRFNIELTEPRRGKTYTDSLRAEARVEVPEGRQVERVEFYLNETRLATLYQPPWAHAIVLPGDQAIAYVRVVAYLPDGNSTEDLVFVNAPDYLEEIDVQLVELYATVLDRSNRPVSGLTEADFTPLEDGAPQQIARFEVVDNLPIHAAVLLDVSASMEPSLAATQKAALEFFEQAIQPKDRGSLLIFNDRPTLKVKFTNNTDLLAGGLAGLKAERGTALYDSIIFSLYYFNGIKGQRALLVLSDGKDESSKFSYEDTLDYARRAGVTVYTIALRDDQTHKKLAKIAQETGGRSFLVQGPEELAGVYGAIQAELRSRYLIAYQSSNTSGSKEFRAVELKVRGSGLEAKTLRGYYP